MIECGYDLVRDLLPMVAGDLLAPDERAAVLQHVGACGACAAELTMLAAARRHFHDVRPIDIESVVVGVQRTTAASNGAGEGSTRTGVRRSRRRPWAIAGAALAAAAALLLVVRMERPDPRAVAAPAATLSLDARLALASDAELELMLAELDDLATTPGDEPEAAFTIDVPAGDIQ